MRTPVLVLGLVLVLLAADPSQLYDHPFPFLHLLPPAASSSLPPLEVRLLLLPSLVLRFQARMTHSAEPLVSQWVPLKTLSLVAALVLVELMSELEMVLQEELEHAFVSTELAVEQLVMLPEIVLLAVETEEVETYGWLLWASQH